MLLEPITLKLDITKRPKKSDVVYVRQGEFNSVALAALIYDDGEPVDLADYDVYIEVEHHNGICASIECDASGNMAKHTFDGQVNAVAEEVRLAYFSLKQHDEDGLQVRCATTQSFAIWVLPDAADEGCGIVEAYSSEIVEMLRLCHEKFTKAEAEREARVNAFLEESGEHVDAAIEDAEDATARANEAAGKVELAIEGNLSPLFKAYLDGLKDVSGGFESWENHLETRVVADGETIERDEETAEIGVKPGSLGDEHIRDEGLTFASIAAILPFLPRTWELEDLSVRCGTLTNGGEGWNTFAFPEPFEAPPVVVCQASGHQVEVGEVLADRFLYRVLNGTSTTFWAYANNTTSLKTSYTVVGGSALTAEPVEVRYIAIEYGGVE